jgi:hypothetical protein
MGTANLVGPLNLPVPAGAPLSAVDDPTISGLMDYIAFWIRTSLNAKLASLQTGRLDGVGTITDAVPTANRFPWDPAAHFVRGEADGAPRPFPALYCWWQGKGARVPYSILKTLRRRDVGVCWVFEEITLPGALIDRHGLRAAVDAAIHSAIDLGYHPEYGHNGAPLGTPIAVSLQLCGFGVRYESGASGLMAPIPGQGAANAGLSSGRADGHIVRGYPSTMVTLQIWEEIMPFQPVDPADVGRAITLTLSTNDEGGVTDAVDVLERFLSAPDGTEEIPEP